MRLRAGIGRVLALVLLAAGSFALYETMRNPKVALLPPLVRARPPQGDEVTVMLGGDFADAQRVQA